MKDAGLYIPVHTGIWDHPKTRRLARRLQTSPVAVVGHLVALWTWAVNYAPDGDLSDFSDDEIGDAARWPEKDRDYLFAEALRECGWLDGKALNDWEHYAGEGLSMRSGARQRKREQRARDAAEKAKAMEKAKALSAVTVTVTSRDASQNGCDMSRDNAVTVTAKSHDVTAELDQDLDQERDRDRTPEVGTTGSDSSIGVCPPPEPSPPPAPAPMPIDRSRQALPVPKVGAVVRYDDNNKPIPKPADPRATVPSREAERTRAALASAKAAEAAVVDDPAAREGLAAVLAAGSASKPRARDPP